MSSNLTIYHEKQIKELCALHALNNLFQEKHFNKIELDNVCHNLSPDVWINPHKSFLGLGNYDINVIMKALQSKGYEAIWFDKRKEPTCINLNKIFGFILNVPSEYKISFITLPLRRRHWIAIKKINNIYYNLDSKLESPEIIGQANELFDYLKEELDNKDKELFLVVTSDVEKNQDWSNNQKTTTGTITTLDGNNLFERDAEIVQLKDIVRDNTRLIISSSSAPSKEDDLRY